MDEVSAVVADYPEHEKLQAIAEESHTIGAFLDFGLSEMGLVLAEYADDPHDGLIPTHKTINQVLAEYFEIDQEKIDAEKEQMLARMREMNSDAV